MVGAVFARDRAEVNEGKRRKKRKTERERETESERGVRTNRNVRLARLETAL